MELLLVRHAEPVRIEATTGRADPELTERGRDQAERLAEWLASERVDHVVSSPLRRAAETAAPLARRLGLTVETVDGLQEYDAQADSYIPVEEMRAVDPHRWQAMVEGRWQDFGGEPPDRFRDRVVPCLEALVAAHPGRRVVVVSHGGVVNVYLGSVLGIERPLWFEPGYTSISRVHAARGGQRSVASVNETAHLVARREP